MVSFFRTIIMYFFVIFVIRYMGKRQVGQLQPYELVIAFMISDLASLPMQDMAIPLLSGIIPILSLLFSQLTISYLLLKSQKARNLICGKKRTVIQNGIIEEKTLIKEMYNLDDLLEALRIRGYPNVSDINIAILENNGELSILPYSRAEPVKRQDLNVNVPEGNITDLILDGFLIEENIESSKVKPGDLLNKIKSMGAKSIKDVLYCYIDTSGELWVQLKKNKETGK